MFIFNQLKTILLLGSLILISNSQFAYSNIELSFNFGKKLQEDGAFKGGYDLLYRIPINEISSTALGLRFDTLQKYNESSLDRTHILLTFLTNYRLHITESFFTGVIAGIDILKTYTLSDSAKVNDDVTLLGALSTNEYLWDRFSAEMGIEFGYQADSGFLMKLELGYDLLSFRCIGGIKVNRDTSIIDTSQDNDEDCTTKFNGIYATLGIGYHF